MSEDVPGLLAQECTECDAGPGQPCVSLSGDVRYRMAAMSAAKRPVCWPNPDQVCAEGGCIHCDTSPVKKTAGQIARAVGLPLSQVVMWWR